MVFTKDKLKSFFTEHWKYLAVSTACKLNLFDHLQEEKTAKQLADDALLNEEKLLLLLNALHNADFLGKNADFFKVNSLSEFLTEKNPESLKYACLNWSSEHLNAWQNFDFSIQTSKSSFEKIYDLPFFDYLNENSERLHAYHQAMCESYERTSTQYISLAENTGFHFEGEIKLSELQTILIFKK